MDIVDGPEEWPQLPTEVIADNGRWRRRRAAIDEVVLDVSAAQRGAVVQHDDHHRSDVL